MKTALELLGEDVHSFLCMTSAATAAFGNSMTQAMELVAKRARAETQRSIEAGQEALRLLRDLHDWTAEGPVSLSDEDRAKIRKLLEAAK